MILFTLIFGWWEYDESKFPKIFNNSWNRPIYAICYSQNCPHCVGIPSRFKMFSQSMANNDDIIYTAIDAGNSTACQTLGAKFVPYFIFARGTKKKYWLHPQFNCPLRWMEFVSDWGSPKIIKVKNDLSDISEHVQKTLNGGSTFILQAPKDSLIFNIYTNLSTKYHIYNDTFIYSESKELTKLTVFTSTNCSHMFDVDSQTIIKIIKEYRFSSLHHLDLQEWSKMTKSKSNSIILLNDGELNGTRLKLLDDLANQHCEDSRFGWAILKDEKAISMKLQQKIESPYIAVINRKNDCQYIQDIKSKENFEILDGFISDSLSDQKVKEKCTHYVAAEKPKEADNKKKNENATKFNIKNIDNYKNEKIQSGKLNIKTISFIALLFIAAISVIGFISYKSNMKDHSDTEAKIE